MFHTEWKAWSGWDWLEFSPVPTIRVTLSLLITRVISNEFPSLP